tara:strand:- start:4336 stop:6150 length:1815 start_codon:yes stop_codon:yes gene_type:complete
VHFQRELKRVTSPLRLKEQLIGNTKKWIVWWYCGIYKNPKAESQPNVLIGFRELSEDGTLSDHLIYRRLPLTTLGQVRIGTVWLEGICLQEVVYDTQKFDVDFTQGSWQITSFQLTTKSEQPPPYPMSIYPLKYEQDRNWLIEFQLKSGGRLILPCLEFFSRCYGRSEELKRILATYPWHGTYGGTDNRLFAPLDQPEEQGKWKVKLKKRLVNGDVVFLAHAKYDRYTELRAKQIYAQIEAGHDPNDRFPAFIKAAPWFRGPAQLKARGVWFDEGKSFLALQIIGCSDPGGLLIERNRENRNNAEHPANPDDESKAWSGAPERTIVKPPEIVDLTSDDEPDHSTKRIEVRDLDFEVLGTPRKVIDFKDKQAKSSAGQKGVGTEANTFSTGEPYSDGRGVGYASIHARPVMESQGTLRDMWNALLECRKNNPTVITNIEWFTFEEGYQKAEEPKLIGIKAFTEYDPKNPRQHEITTSIRNWPYIDSTTKTDLRGLLVVRLTLNTQYIYILEIQRRPRKKKDNNGLVKNSEEAFKGFVFKLKNQDFFEKYLNVFLSDIRYVKGIVQHLVRSCPGDAASFNHSVSNADSHPCESAVENALEKMNVLL